MQRTISFRQGIALYMGAVLGSGILVLPGFTAMEAGPASILSWLVMGLISLPIAYSFARLALKVHDAGGVASIVERAFGPLWGAQVGWYFFTWVSVGESVVGLTGAAYIAKIWDLSELWVYFIAWGFLIVALSVNILGMKFSGNFALWLSAAVLILLLATIAFSFPQLESQHFTPFAPHGLTGIMSACVLIFWAFFGWESITHLVPEFRHPERDVMRCTYLSVGLISVVYLLLAVVTVGTNTYGLSNNSAPLATLMNKALGLHAGAATALVACIVCLGTLNVYLASSSRLGYSLARSGSLPPWFGKLNRRGVPHRSAFFLFVTNSCMLFASYVFRISVDQLILIPTTLGIVVYLISSIACLKLLWQDPIGRAAALISTLSCAAIVPFAAGYMIAPILVSASYLLYRRFMPAGFMQSD